MKSAYLEILPAHQWWFDFHLPQESDEFSPVMDFFFEDMDQDVFSSDTNHFAQVVGDFIFLQESFGSQ